VIKILDEASAILIESCPSFAPRHRGLITEWEDEVRALPKLDSSPPLFSDVIEELRLHILDMIRSGQHKSELERVFHAIERVLAEGNGTVRSAVGVALIEHTKREKRPPGPEREVRRSFKQHLGPEGRKQWDIS
jgi:hypothetical protein